MVLLCMGRTTAGAQAPVKSGMSSKCDYTVCSSEGTCDGSHKKAWELGVGFNGLQMTRFNVTGFRVNPQGGYNIDTDKRDLFLGGHVYVARELNRFFLPGLSGAVRLQLRPCIQRAYGAMGRHGRAGLAVASGRIFPFQLHRSVSAGRSKLHAQEFQDRLYGDART